MHAAAMYGIRHCDDEKQRKVANALEKAAGDWRFISPEPERTCFSLSNRNDALNCPNPSTSGGRIMDRVASILCVGEDPDLLRTRAMLLEQLGTEVT